MFHRHPITPELLNTKVVSETDCFVGEDPNIVMPTKIVEVTAVQAKVIVCSMNYN